VAKLSRFSTRRPRPLRKLFSCLSARRASTGLDYFLATIIYYSFCSHMKAIKRCKKFELGAEKKGKRGSKIYGV